MIPILRPMRQRLLHHHRPRLMPSTLYRLRIQSISISHTRSSPSTNDGSSPFSSTPTRFVTGPPLRFPVLSLSLTAIRIQILHGRMEREMEQWKKKRESILLQTDTGFDTGGAFETEFPASATCKRLLGQHFNHPQTLAVFTLIDRFSDSTQLTPIDLEEFVQEQPVLSHAARNMRKLVNLQIQIAELEMEFHHLHSHNSTLRTPIAPSTTTLTDSDVLTRHRRRASTLTKIWLESEMAKWSRPSPMFIDSPHTPLLDAAYRGLIWLVYQVHNVGVRIFFRK